MWEHWKVQALVHRVGDVSAAGDELVVIDAVLDGSARRLSDGVARRDRRGDVRVDGIKTYDVRGIDQRAIDALRTWSEGGDIPRI